MVVVLIVILTLTLYQSDIITKYSISAEIVKCLPVVFTFELFLFVRSQFLFFYWNNCRSAV